MKSCTGSNLVTVQYLPSETVRAGLCFHHGVQEHIGRYHNIFTKMADSGIAVYSLDAVGHGKSEGERGYVEKFSNLVDDFETLCTTTLANADAIQSPSSASGRVPMFIGGHSLGGLVAAITCLRDQSRWNGLLLSDPALDVEWTPMLRIQAALGNLLAAVVPKARIVPAVDPKYMNRDPVKVQEYIDDPLNVVGPLAARTGNESLKAFRQLAKQRAELEVPVYAHHGTKDMVTSLKATQYVRINPFLSLIQDFQIL